MVCAAASDHKKQKNKNKTKKKKKKKNTHKNQKQNKKKKKKKKKKKLQKKKKKKKKKKGLESGYRAPLSLQTDLFQDVQIYLSLIIFQLVQWKENKSVSLLFLSHSQLCCWFPCE